MTSTDGVVQPAALPRHSFNPTAQPTRGASSSSVAIPTLVVESADVDGAEDTQETSESTLPRGHYAKSQKRSGNGSGSGSGDGAPQLPTPSSDAPPKVPAQISSSLEHILKLAEAYRASATAQAKNEGTTLTDVQLYIVVMIKLLSEVRDHQIKFFEQRLEVLLQEHEKARQERFEKIREHQEKVRKARKKAKMIKIFMIVGAALAIVLAVTMVVFSGGSALIILGATLALIGGIIAMVNAFPAPGEDSVTGQGIISKSFYNMGKEFGMSDEEAKKFGVWMVFAIQIALAVGSMGVTAGASIIIGIKALASAIAQGAVAIGHGAAALASMTAQEAARAALMIIIKIVKAILKAIHTALKALYAQLQAVAHGIAAGVKGILIKITHAIRMIIFAITNFSAAMSKAASSIQIAVKTLLAKLQAAVKIIVQALKQLATTFQQQGATAMLKEMYQMAYTHAGTIQTIIRALYIGMDFARTGVTFDLVATTYQARLAQAAGLEAGAAIARIEGDSEAAQQLFRTYLESFRTQLNALIAIIADERQVKTNVAQRMAHA